ncbi:unnamed protein product, partial [Discosporangium mesarthrocarpum]
MAGSLVGNDDSSRESEDLILTPGKTAVDLALDCDAWARVWDQESDGGDEEDVSSLVPPGDDKDVQERVSAVSEVKNRRAEARGPDLEPSEGRQAATHESDEVLLDWARRKFAVKGGGVAGPAATLSLSDLCDPAVLYSIVYSLWGNGDGKRGSKEWGGLTPPKLPREKKSRSGWSVIGKVEADRGQGGRTSASRAGTPGRPSMVRAIFGSYLIVGQQSWKGRSSRRATMKLSREVSRVMSRCPRTVGTDLLPAEDLGDPSRMVERACSGDEKSVMALLLLLYSCEAFMCSHRSTRSQVSPGPGGEAVGGQGAGTGSGGEGNMATEVIEDELAMAVWELKGLRRRGSASMVWPSSSAATSSCGSADNSWHSTNLGRWPTPSKIQNSMLRVFGSGGVKDSVAGGELWAGARSGGGMPRGHVAEEGGAAAG